MTSLRVAWLFVILISFLVLHEHPLVAETVGNRPEPVGLAGSGGKPGARHERL